MPPVIRGNVNNNNRFGLNIQGDLGYEYPDDLDLRPGSDLSLFIINEITQRAYESSSIISQRHGSWREMDEILTAYKVQDDEEIKVKSKDSRKPTSIVFPYTYAIKETLLTYAMSALVQDPIFQYAGTGPEDTVGAILLQKKIQMDCEKTKVALAIHTMISDALSYGIGIGAPGWDIRRGTVYKQPSSGILNELKRFIGRSADTVVSENAILFEGNKLENIDPYQILPDPNVSCHKIQEGDFYGWVEECSRINLLSQEQMNEDYFNVRYLKGISSLRSGVLNSQRDKPDKDAISSIDMTDVIHMYVNLVPKDWKLGESEYPEKWLFSVAADSVIIRAKPLGLTHGMYPISVIAPDYDGYSIAPLSRLEMLKGLQTTTDFLFNSHIANVRKAVNDMLIVDPFMLNMKDLQSPEPGKLIRTRRPAWGKGVKDAVHQLAITDITRSNINDVNWIVQFMNHVSGVDEAMMGSLRQGGPERLTGAEFNGTRQSAISRLNKMTMLMSVMGMNDIAYFFASHTQQLMTKDTYVKATGDWPAVLEKEYAAKAKNGVLKASPYDLKIDYDIISRNGSIPGNQSSEAWLRLFDILMTNPEMNKEFDVVRIFKHIARELGEKNVDDFTRAKTQEYAQTQATVMPDDVVRQQVQAGNLVPMGE
jgi:hypothetical protein